MVLLSSRKVRHNQNDAFPFIPNFEKKKSEIVLSSIHIEIINTYANHISYEIEQAFWIVS